MCVLMGVGGCSVDAAGKEGQESSRIGCRDLTGFAQDQNLDSAPSLSSTE